MRIVLETTCFIHLHIDAYINTTYTTLSDGLHSVTAQCPFILCYPTLPLGYKWILMELNHPKPKSPDLQSGPLPLRYKYPYYIKLFKLAGWDSNSRTLSRAGLRPVCFNHLHTYQYSLFLFTSFIYYYITTKLSFCQLFLRKSFKNFSNVFT